MAGTVTIYRAYHLINSHCWAGPHGMTSPEVGLQFEARYNWRPHEDISVYELALCTPLLGGASEPNLEYFESLPESARRHFSAD